MERKAHSDKAGVSTQTQCFSGRFRISTSSFLFCLELCRNVVSRIAKLKSYTNPQPINNKLHMLPHGCQSCPEPQTTPPEIEQRNRKLGLSVFFCWDDVWYCLSHYYFFWGAPSISCQSARLPIPHRIWHAAQTAPNGPRRAALRLDSRDTQSIMDVQK